MPSVARNAVNQRLESWSSKWNQGQPLYDAPKPAGGIATYMKLWESWYENMKHLALDAKADD